MTNTTLANNFYPVANAMASTNPFVDQFETRNPTVNDVNYPIQKKWLNTVNLTYWALMNFVSSNGVVTANWIQIGANDLTTIYTANTGTATALADDLNVLGSSGVTTTASGNTITITASEFVPAYTNVTHAMSPYMVVATDEYISVDCSGGAVTLNFPNAPASNRTFIVKDRTGNATTNNITLTTPGGTVTFDGATSYVMKINYLAVNLLANATPTYEVY